MNNPGEKYVGVLIRTSDECSWTSSARQKAERQVAGGFIQSRVQFFIFRLCWRFTGANDGSVICQKLTTLPVYVEQAAKLIHKGNTRLNKDSVVVTLSKSVIPKESVAIAEWCKAQEPRKLRCAKMRTLSLARAAAIFRCVQKWRGDMNICCCTGCFPRAVAQ